MKKIILILILALVPSFGVKALLVVDVQPSMVSPGLPPLTQKNKKEISNIVDLMKEVKVARFLVTFKIENPEDFKDSKGLDDPIQRLEEAAGKDAVLFKKVHNSAFSKDATTQGGKPFDFKKELTERGIDTLVITGLNQNACVLESIKDAMSLGIKVVASNSLMFTSGSDSSALEDRWAKKQYKSLIKKGLVFKTKEEVLAFLKQ